MKVQFFAGDLVKVLPSSDWPNGATGKVAVPPGQITGRTGDWANGVFREETRPGGVVTVYWVEFDTPQLDFDGDGPYTAGSVKASDLKSI